MQRLFGSVETRADMYNFGDANVAVFQPGLRTWFNASCCIFAREFYSYMAHLLRSNLHIFVRANPSVVYRGGGKITKMLCWWPPLYGLCDNGVCFIG